HGIDLLNLHATKPLLAVQCKRKERQKRLSKSEILQEVGKAEGCSHHVERYIIATTAQKSRQTQDVVIQLNQRPDETRRFVVEIVFWEDICAELNGLDRIIAEGILYGTDTAAGDHAPNRVHASNGGVDFHSVLTNISTLIDSRQVAIAEYELGHL